jgi:hypothetical protein
MKNIIHITSHQMKKKSDLKVSSTNAMDFHHLHFSFYDKISIININ